MQHALMQHVLQHVQVGGLDFEFDLEAAADQPLQAYCTVTPSQADPDTWLVRFSAACAGGTPFSVCGLAVRWQVPVIDMHGFFGGSPWPMDLIGLPFWEVAKVRPPTTASPLPPSSIAAAKGAMPLALSIS